MRLPKHSTIALPLLFIGILVPALPLLGSDGTDESSTSSPAPARLRMASDTLDQTDPRNCVSQAAEMTNAENLAGYLEYFSAGSQKKLRKEAALFFTRHDVEMDLLDAHVVGTKPTQHAVITRLGDNLRRRGMKRDSESRALVQTGHKDLEEHNRPERWKDKNDEW